MSVPSFIADDPMRLLPVLIVGFGLIVVALFRGTVDLAQFNLLHRLFGKGDE